LGLALAVGSAQSGKRPGDTDIKAVLDKAAAIGQLILTPVLHVACGGGGVVLGLMFAEKPHSDPWQYGFCGLLAGVIIATPLVWLSNHLIKWALVALGIMFVGSL
jgi:hypothetical protein